MHHLVDTDRDPFVTHGRKNRGPVMPHFDNTFPAPCFIDQYGCENITVRTVVPLVSGCANGIHEPFQSTGFDLEFSVRHGPEVHKPIGNGQGCPLSFVLLEYPLSRRLSRLGNGGRPPG